MPLHQLMKLVAATRGHQRARQVQPNRLNCGTTAIPSHKPGRGPPPTTSLPDLLGEGVVTELGGVLYLINLMVALDLPDAFEVGWRLASGVGPWGLLEALGRALLGEDPTAAALHPQPTRTLCGWRWRTWTVGRRASRRGCGCRGAGRGGGRRSSCRRRGLKRCRRREGELREPRARRPRPYTGDTPWACGIGRCWHAGWGWRCR